ncbi:MAG: ArnT family glycosyltransferase [Rhodospirillaceae bacterium]
MTARHVYAACLALAWILPGLIGHDPWKPDEAYTFGVVYELLRGGSWIVPHLAGEPYIDAPPLFHLTAAVMARLLSPPLALHDAARMATGLYMGLTLLFCGLAGRELHGRGFGTVSMLLLLGAFGLVIRSHQLITDVAALAGFAVMYYGWALSTRSLWGGVWLGTGLGVIFMSQGVLATGIAAAISLALPIVHRDWRTMKYGASAVLAVLFAAPWLVIWPMLLHAEAPAVFELWLNQELSPGLFATDELAFYVGILPWYGWPLWPLALWALWCTARQRKFDAGIALPVVGVFITLLVLTFTSYKGELHALPVLLPLALLGTPAVASLRRGATNGWYWFGIMGFTFFIVVAWFYWSALELGVPARLHAHLHRLQPGYTPGFRWLPFVIGVAYTIAWFAVLVRLKRSPERPAIVWASGVTAVWALLAVLFVGWLDTGKSYRSMIASLEAALPRHYRCIASANVGEPQRAMLQYFADIETRRVGYRPDAAACDLMLVQGRPGAEERPPGPWRRIWEGNRPGDKAERYRLYQRSGERHGSR